jgi:hypothetical protein
MYSVKSYPYMVRAFLAEKTYGVIEVLRDPEVRRNELELHATIL